MKREYPSPKQWQSFSEKDIRKIRLRDCGKCKYFTRYSDLDGLSASCDYLHMSGKIRPCQPGQCRAAGVWEDKETDIHQAVPERE